MKIIVLLTTLAMAVGTGAMVLLRSTPNVSAGGSKEISPHSSERLQAKIDAIRTKKASKSQVSEGPPAEIPQEPSDEPEKNPPPAVDPDVELTELIELLELTESELESYVLFTLREKLPVQLDYIGVQLGDGSIASDSQVTFTSSTTGNPLVDALAGGTHNLFIRGRLVGEDGRGQFDLDEVRVDGIPVPAVLIETLFEKYVKPEYPDADLRQPFNLPWGIKQITIVPGKATVVY